MSNATGNNCGACNSPEVQALFCELLDERTSYARALEIREHIAQCDDAKHGLKAKKWFVRSFASVVLAPKLHSRCVSASPSK